MTSYDSELGHPKQTKAAPSPCGVAPLSLISLAVRDLRLRQRCLRLAAQVLVEERVHIGPGDGLGACRAGGRAEVDADLVGEEADIRERRVLGAGHLDPALPAGHLGPVPLPHV